MKIKMPVPYPKYINVKEDSNSTTYRVSVFFVDNCKSTFYLQEENLMELVDILDAEEKTIKVFSNDILSDIIMVNNIVKIKIEEM